MKRALYRGNPKLDVGAVYDIAGRRARYVGTTTDEGRGDLFHFEMEGELEPSRSISRDDLVSYLHIGAFRVASA
jgi:hypothetical protein